MIQKNTQGNSQRQLSTIRWWVFSPMNATIHLFQVSSIRKRLNDSGNIDQTLLDIYNLKRDRKKVLEEYLTNGTDEELKARKTALMEVLSKYNLGIEFKSEVTEILGSESNKLSEVQNFPNPIQPDTKKVSLFPYFWTRSETFLANLISNPENCDSILDSLNKFRTDVSCRREKMLYDKERKKLLKLIVELKYETHQKIKNSLIELFDEEIAKRELSLVEQRELIKSIKDYFEFEKVAREKGNDLTKKTVEVSELLRYLDLEKINTDEFTKNLLIGLGNRILEYVDSTKKVVNKIDSGSQKEWESGLAFLKLVTNSKKIKEWLDNLQRVA